MSLVLKIKRLIRPEGWPAFANLPEAEQKRIWKATCPRWNSRQFWMLSLQALLWACIWFGIFFLVPYILGIPLDSSGAGMVWSVLVGGIVGFSIMMTMRLFFSKKLVAQLRAEGYCVQCGYNLEGNVSGVCPECGERI